MANQPAVLVTGGAGYVGSHTCKALHRSGVTPVTLDNLSTGHRQAVRWGPLEVGDVRDEDFVADVLMRHKVIAVLHFAALSLVSESAGKAHEYYENNVGAVIALVSAMRRSGVSRIVFSSTCAVYGTPEKLPIEETEATRPINVYGRTKLVAENFLEDVAATGSIRTVMLRYFNAAGADTEGDIGEAHVAETHLVPLAIEAALDQSRSLSIFGTDYPTPDGTCERDYVHVEDLAEAHIKALSFLETTGGASIFNLGTGRPVSVREVLRAVERVLATKVPINEVPRRVGDPPRLFAAAGRAQRDLAWAATKSDIDYIVETAARWHQRKFSAG